MTQELVYTSAPRGLKPGTRGFCTVVSTQQMSQPLAERLESLSGYRHLFAAHDAQAELNPVIHSHLTLAIGGRKYHVLSRIADAGLDYTQRSNKLAHHVMLDATELPSGGPAWLLAQPGFMQTEWDGEPKLVPTGRHPPSGFDAPAVCRHWQELTGDAGWAGVLAETATGPSPRPACVFFRPGQDLLPLVSEALALLPHQQRWNVTFSTWFTKLPPGVDCQWRFLLADSPEAKQARRQAQTLLIDLTAPLPNAGSSAMAQAARTGIVTAPPRPTGAPAAPLAPGLPHEAAPAGHRALRDAPPVHTEYGVGPPPIMQSARPISRRGPRKRRFVAKAAIILAGLAAIVLVVTGGVLVGIHVARETSVTTVRNGAAKANGASGEKPSESPSPGGIDEGPAPSADSVMNADDEQKTGDRGLADEPRPSGLSERRPEQEAANREQQGDVRATSAVSAPPNQNVAVPTPAAAGALQNDQPNDSKHSSDVDASAAAGEAVTEKELNGLAAVDLMPQRNGRPIATPVEVIKVTATDRSQCKLRLLGCDNFFQEKVSVQQHSDGGQVYWQVGCKPDLAIGDPKKIGRFDLKDDILVFQSQNPDIRLRNCLLSITSDDGAVRVIALRTAKHLSPASLSFEKPTHSVDIPLEDSADEIKQDLMRLRVHADPIADATVTPSDPVSLSKEVHVIIPFRPKGQALHQVKRDVDIRIKLSRTGANLQLVMTSYGNQAELNLTNGKWESHPLPLSIDIVAGWKSLTDEKLTRLKKRIEEADKDLKELPPAPKDPKDDTHKKDRDDANKRKSDATKLQQECNEELQRCDDLTEMLNALHGTIRFTVFYPVSAYEVILADTKVD